MALLTSCAFLSSCSSEIEPSDNNVSSCKELEKRTYQLDIELPTIYFKDYRSFDAEEKYASWTADGRELHTRNIDRLWYAAYHKGELMFESETYGHYQPDYQYDKDAFVELSSHSRGFMMRFRLPDNINPNDVELFFWAGNHTDNVKIGEGEEGDITLDFENLSVRANMTALNRINADDPSLPGLYDSFARYCKLSDLGQNLGLHYNNLSMKLHSRPFARIDMVQDVNESGDYEDVTSISGLCTQSSAIFTMLPQEWHYGMPNENARVQSSEFEYVNGEEAREYTSAKADMTDLFPSGHPMRKRDLTRVTSIVFLASPTTQVYNLGGSTNLSEYVVKMQHKSTPVNRFEVISLPATGVKGGDFLLISNKADRPHEFEVTNMTSTNENLYVLCPRR